MYKLSLSQCIKLHTSNKTFALFDIEKNTNRVINLRFTNDLNRHRRYYSTFRLLEVVIQETELLTIN